MGPGCGAAGRWRGGRRRRPAAWRGPGPSASTTREHEPCEGRCCDEREPAVRGARVAGDFAAAAAGAAAAAAAAVAHQAEESLLRASAEAAAATKVASDAAAEAVKMANLAAASARNAGNQGP